MFIDLWHEVALEWCSNHNGWSTLLPTTRQQRNRLKRVQL